MIKVNDFKQILAKNNIDNLSEADIIKLRDQQDQLADVFFDMWLEQVKNEQTEV